MLRDLGELQRRLREVMHSANQSFSELNNDKGTYSNMCSYFHGRRDLSQDLLHVVNSMVVDERLKNRKKNQRRRPKTK